MLEQLSGSQLGAEGRCGVWVRGTLGLKSAGAVPLRPRDLAAAGAVWHGGEGAGVVMM